MTAPELVAPGVYRVDAIGPKNLLNALLLENDDGWTLVDTGVAASVERVKGALAALGSGPEGLRRVFLTHHHGDHTGGLPGLLEWAPHAEVGATEKDAEVVSGARPPDPPSSPHVDDVTGRSKNGPGVVERSLRRSLPPFEDPPS